MAQAREMIRDFSRIRLTEQSDTVFSPEDSAVLFEADARWLDARLDAPHDGPTVVITHHAPSRNSVHPRFARSPLSAAALQITSVFRYSRKPGPTSGWSSGV